MKIEFKDGIAKVYTPYNPDFVSKIKGVGGAKWNGTEKCWNIPAEAIEVARTIMTDVYGYNDESTNETVSLKLTFKYRYCKDRTDVVMFGKILSHAYGRDSGAKVGDDVAYICGGATSGGSAHNWQSIVKEDSVVTLSNVNINVYEREKDSYDEYITVEVIDQKINCIKLLEEKERLLKRIAEIDKLLEQEDNS